MIRAAAYIIFITFITIITVIFSSSAFAQTCNNFARTDGLVSTPTLSGKFGSSINKCITGNNQAALPSFQLPTFTQLKSQFYTTATPSITLGKKEIPGGCPFDPPNQTNSNMLILSDVGQTINVTCTPNSLVNQTNVIFIQGSLTINSNINYHCPNPSVTGSLCDSTGGLVFVVQGDINISPTVTQIDAVLIAGGIIYTAASSGTCATNSVSVASPLIINGSLISLNPNTGAQSIFFCRSLANNSVAGEQINFQPKYLVNLKDIFSSPLSIQIPNADYVPPGNVSSCTPTCPAANTVSCGQSRGPDGCGGSCGTGTLCTNPAVCFAGSCCTPSCANPSTVACGQAISNGCGGSCPSGTQCSVGNVCSGTTCVPSPFISVTPTTPVGGSNATVTWGNIISPTSTDKLALYSSGSPGSSWITQLGTSCGGSGAAGSCAYAIPNYLPQGSYDFQYIKNGNYASPDATTTVTIKCQYCP